MRKMVGILLLTAGLALVIVAVVLIEDDLLAIATAIVGVAIVGLGVFSIWGRESVLDMMER
jgi:hypothetical protein